jgi:DNA polymerase I
VRLSKTPEQYAAARTQRQEAAYEALLAAGRTHWAPGERVRCYRNARGAPTWLPDERDDTARLRYASDDAPSARKLDERRDYDVEHYVELLVTSYAARLKKAFAPEDFDRLFRLDLQPGLFDEPVEQIEPLWIRATQPVD